MKGEKKTLGSLVGTVTEIYSAEAGDACRKVQWEGDREKEAQLWEK